jgi:hypothetical protein
MRPTLVVNPSDDDEFSDYGHRLLTEWITLDDFRQRLRARYPRAAVHQRELANEAARVWYVYREGRWVPSRRAGRSESHP